MEASMQLEPSAMFKIKTVVFRGSSDDIIDVTGCHGADEFHANHADGPVMAKFNLGGQIRIFALYDGCWSFAVGQVDEETPLPEWPVAVRQSTTTSYSTELTIEVADKDGQANLTREF